MYEVLHDQRTAVAARTTAGFILAVVIFAASSQAQQLASTLSTTLIVCDAMVIDGAGAPPEGPRDILVRGDRIESILPSATPSRCLSADTKQAASIRRIEAKGSYVVPGFIDMHMHFIDLVPLDYQYKLLIAHGVTTVRVFSIGEMSPEQMVAEKRRVASAKVVAPRLYVYPFWSESLEDPRFHSAKDAPAIVREWKAKGIDGVKMASLPGEYPDVFAAVGAETRKQQMGLAVHIAQGAVYPMNAVRIAESGATTIEHHYGYAEASFTAQQIQRLPPSYNFANTSERFYQTGAAWLQADLNKLHTNVIDSLLVASTKTGFAMVPTMVAYEPNRDVERAETLRWQKDFAPPVLLHQWIPDAKNPESSYFTHWTSNQEADWSQVFYRWMDFINDYKNRGGQVAVGSDPGFIYNLWGFGTIRELELLEQAGFSPLETLHAATEAGALALGNHQLGVIRPGYTADLLVLDANPLEDLKVLYGTGATRLDADGKPVQVRALRYTVRGGIVFDAQKLLDELTTQVAAEKANIRP
ncbi:amidohydrolase family protein [Telmatobacter bradus]|uniref:amidohydrolase family protein n=1 Tax=Telmatobacter bradus TaxID=474953 RepID=UPI003B4393D6